MGYFVGSAAAASPLPRSRRAKGESSQSQSSSNQIIPFVGIRINLKVQFCPKIEWFMMFIGQNFFLPSTQFIMCCVLCGVVSSPPDCFNQCPGRFSLAALLRSHANSHSRKFNCLYLDAHVEKVPAICFDCPILMKSRLRRENPIMNTCWSVCFAAEASGKRIDSYPLISPLCLDKGYRWGSLRASWCERGRIAHLWLRLSATPKEILISSERTHMFGWALLLQPGAIPQKWWKLVY